MKFIPKLISKIICFIVFLTMAPTCFACIPDIWNLKTNAFKGQVLDPYGNAVPNAILEVFRTLKGDEQLITRLATDSQGHFDNSRLSPGKYLIKVKSEWSPYTYLVLKLKERPKKVIKKELVFTIVTHGDCTGTAKIRELSN